MTWTDDARCFPADYPGHPANAELDPDAAYERHQDLLIDMAEEQRAEAQIEEHLLGQAAPDEGIPDDPYWEEANAHWWEDTLPVAMALTAACRTAQQEADRQKQKEDNHDR